MTGFWLIVEVLMDLFMVLTMALYIHCQIVLYRMIKHGVKEKLSTFLYIVFFSGFVSLLVIANEIFFQILPTILWQDFFYSLGPAGARIHYMVNFGCEMFVILCEAFIALSRYLTFIRSDLSKNYWRTEVVRKWLLAILAVSVAYATVYFFCDFWTIWDNEEKIVRFNFAENKLEWVGMSMFIPFTMATASFLCCIYCYWHVATIIRGSPQTKLRRSTVMKMCLSSSIISFGAFLSLLLRIMNHICYLVTADDLIPIPLYYVLIKIGKKSSDILKSSKINNLAALTATCGNPWILMALFQTVREEAFPCSRNSLKTLNIPTVATTGGS